MRSGTSLKDKSNNQRTSGARCSSPANVKTNLACEADVEPGTPSDYSTLGVHRRRKMRSLVSRRNSWHLRNTPTGDQCILGILDFSFSVGECRAASNDPLCLVPWHTPSDS